MPTKAPRQPHKPISAQHKIAWIYDHSTNTVKSCCVIQLYGSNWWCGVEKQHYLADDLHDTKVKAIEAALGHCDARRHRIVAQLVLARQERNA